VRHVEVQSTEAKY
jgi:hypothetical protein